MAEMGVGDEPELLEQLECSVDGRDVDRSDRLPHFRQDLVRRGVPERLNCLEDQLPLRRQPVAPSPEHALPVTHARSLRARCLPAEQSTKVKRLVTTVFPGYAEIDQPVVLPRCPT
jgi:hypothetical protein